MIFSLTLVKNESASCELGKRLKHVENIISTILVGPGKLFQNGEDCRLLSIGLLCKNFKSIIYIF